MHTYIMNRPVLVLTPLVLALSACPAFSQEPDAIAPTTTAAAINPLSPAADANEAIDPFLPKPGTVTSKAEELPLVNLLEGIRTQALAVSAEGTGDGRMTVTVTNQSRKLMRVVLPPGLVASGATGQFGGGGMGGMGGGGMGGMGGGGLGGMGGGGMGGMGGGMGGMGGGMGGMGGGGMRGGGQTMPPQMGMMMLSRIIMHLCGDLDSWDPSSLSIGMMGGMGGMGGGGMGGMGGGMGGMGGGMGGMGGGMGGMGGMGGGFRSVPTTGPMSATLQPGQTRRLPTRVVSLGRPDEAGKVALPMKGEVLRLGEIADLTENPMVQMAVRRMALEKTPETVAQLVLWRVSAGLDWALITRLGGRNVKPEEVALARHIVEGLCGPLDDLGPLGIGSLYLSVDTEDADDLGLVQAVKDQFRDQTILGLEPRFDTSKTPPGPAVACEVHLKATGQPTRVIVYTTETTGHAWKPLAKFEMKDANPADAHEFADKLAGELAARLVPVELVKGRREHGKETFKIHIRNASPLVLNGLSIGGAAGSEEAEPSTLAGFSLPPHKDINLPATADAVERLGLKEGIRAVAADLNEF